MLQKLMQLIAFSRIGFPRLKATKDRSIREVLYGFLAALGMTAADDYSEFNYRLLLSSTS
jgi:hypothetical protein